MTQTLDSVGRLGNSSVSVEHLHLQTAQRRAVESVPHQEGAISSVQRWRDVDTDMLLLIR